MYKPSTYLIVTYFLPTYLPIFLPAYLLYIWNLFLKNWLPRWKQILSPLRFIHNWVIMGIQWMIVRWWVLQLLRKLFSWWDLGPLSFPSFLVLLRLLEGNVAPYCNCNNFVMLAFMVLELNYMISISKTWMLCSYKAHLPLQFHFIWDNVLYSKDHSSDY
jgi:hypothetical protein